MNNRNTTDTKASITAISVAMAYTRALSSKHSTLENASEAALAMHLWSTGRRALGWSNWTLTGVISSAPYSSQESFFNSIVMPGYDSIILYRKLMIKSQIEAAIKKGVKQIVFLGSGYDVRALITAAQFPDVQVYEIDHGATRAGKVKAIKTIPQGLGFDLLTVNEDETSLHVGSNLKLIDCDLGQYNVKYVLLAHGYKAHEDSLVIAEGLTTYLDEASNKRLLADVAELLTENSGFLISYLSTGEREISRIEKNALDESKEVYQFTIDPENVLELTLESGLTPTGRFDATKYLRAGGEAAAAYHEAKPNAPREHYYLLCNDGMIINSITHVPDIDFTPPTAAAPPSSYCNLL